MSRPSATSSPRPSGGPPAARAGGNARIAFASPTALEADLVATGTYPAATTYAQAAAVLDAEPLVNMRLTGAQLKTVLEQQWQRTSGGTCPARPFLRLGASAGFTWTHDATRPEGDRITGMWLDGAAARCPHGTYSVTVSQSLADGGDNFRGFTGGLVPQVRDATTVSALAAYVGDASAAGPLAAPATQHAVGVHVPGGAPTSYVAGTTYAVDLSSWSYSDRRPTRGHDRRRHDRRSRRPAPSRWTTPSPTTRTTTTARSRSAPPSRPTCPRAPRP